MANIETCPKHLNATAMSYIRLCCSLACLVALLIPSLVAKAKGPFDKVVISGRGLPDVIEVTDSAILDELDFSELVDFERPAPPPSTGENYALTYYYADGSGNSRPGPTMRYYPDPGGGIGIFYNNYTLQTPWFYATPEGDKTVKRLLPAVGGRNTLFWDFALTDDATFYLLTGFGAVLSLVIVRRRFIRATNIRR